MYHVNEEEDHERTRSDALPLLLHIYTGGHDPRVRWVGQTNAIVGSNRAERVRPMVVGQCSAWVRSAGHKHAFLFQFCDAKSQPSRGAQVAAATYARRTPPLSEISSSAAPPPSRPFW